jgi:hypothetical protein
MNGSAAIAESCAFLAACSRRRTKKESVNRKLCRSLGVLSRRGSSQSNEKTLHRVCFRWQTFAKAHSSNEFAAKENGYNRSYFHSRHRGRIPDHRSGNARAVFTQSKKLRSRPRIDFACAFGLADPLEANSSTGLLWAASCLEIA